MLPPPDPAGVETILYLLADAGDVREEHSPLLHRMQRDIEEWSSRMPVDAEVVVAVLGDIVYPEGLHPRDHPAYHSDTAVVMSQVRLVLGPAARAREARIYFTAGNHDWGSRKHRAGEERLRNLEHFLDEVSRRSGASIQLAPAAGRGGPHVVDLGDHLRMLLLDTAWWLLSADPSAQAAVLAGVEDAVAGRQRRELLIAAHHPFRSVGPHGGFFPFWQAAGVRYLLTRSGAILQDLTSIPYRGLENGLRRIFERHEPPLVFAGGHEHSLQVIEGVAPTDPRFNVVSGAGSKLTDVGYDEGVRFAESVPGYMRLFVERSGRMTLFVEATAPEYLKCEGPDAPDCISRGLAAFRTVYTQRLR